MFGRTYIISESGRRMRLPYANLEIRTRGELILLVFAHKFSRGPPLIIEHRRLRIRSAKLDTTIQDFVVILLDRELSGDGGTNRNVAKREEQDG